MNSIIVILSSHNSSGKFHTYIFIVNAHQLPPLRVLGVESIRRCTDVPSTSTSSTTSSSSGALAPPHSSFTARLLMLLCPSSNSSPSSSHSPSSSARLPLMRLCLCLFLRLLPLRGPRRKGFFVDRPSFLCFILVYFNLFGILTRHEGTLDRVLTHHIYTENISYQVYVCSM